MKFEILLRVCNKSENNPDMKRIINVTRDELILRCLKSLVDSLNYLYDKSPQQVGLTVIADLTDEFRKGFFKELNYSKYFYHFENKELDNNQSMKYCYEYAKENFADDSVIFFCEDDYLYFPNCFTEIIAAYEVFKYKLGGAEVAIHPADSPLEYFPNSIYPSRIVLGFDRHWRTSVSCPFTMLIAKTAFNRFYDKFMDYSKFDGVNYHEANTINLMFIDQVNLFTPIPSLCFHLGYIDPPAPFCDHKQLWEDNKI